MNKTIAGGIVIIIIVSVIGIAYSLTSEFDDEKSPINKISDLEESSTEGIIEETEQTGRELSVEFNESIGLTTP